MTDGSEDDIRKPPGIRPPETPKSAFPFRVVAAVIVLSVVVVGFVSCVSSFGDDSDSSTSSVPSKYVQTWDESYSNTTCTEWNGSMSAAQQFAAAADMLAGARNKGDGGSGLPPDSLIDEFSAGVTTACVIPDASLAEIAAGLYLTEPRFKP